MAHAQAADVTIRRADLADADQVGMLAEQEPDRDWSNQMVFRLSL
jgi:hypothetical protein